MTRKKTSPVWMLDKKEMQELLNNCSSFVEVLEKLGLDGHSGNHRTLKERIKQDSLNIEELSSRRKEKIRQCSIRKKIPLNKIMVENSSYGTNHLKKRILEDKILEYSCEECKNNGEWMGKNLVLQLEHKNGNSKDHRLGNLCFLCPNCHTQTKTYAGRNSSLKRSKICVECKGPTKGMGSKCRKCASQKQPKKFFVTKEELQKLVEIYPLTTIGKKFGVCGNSIKKRCRSFGIENNRKKK
jgi:hypothetical protein